MIDINAYFPGGTRKSDRFILDNGSWEKGPIYFVDVVEQDLNDYYSSSQSSYRQKPMQGPNRELDALTLAKTLGPNCYLSHATIQLLLELKDSNGNGYPIIIDLLNCFNGSHMLIDAAKVIARYLKDEGRDFRGGTLQELIPIVDKLAEHEMNRVEHNSTSPTLEGFSGDYIPMSEERATKVIAQYLKEDRKDFSDVTPQELEAVAERIRVHDSNRLLYNQMSK